PFSRTGKTFSNIFKAKFTRAAPTARGSATYATKNFHPPPSSPKKTAITHGANFSTRRPIRKIFSSPATHKKHYPPTAQKISYQALPCMRISHTPHSISKLFSCTRHTHAQNYFHALPHAKNTIRPAAQAPSGLFHYYI
ncbi:MAG: hypothetical protein ACI308_02150, partial [Muribaculaceae bacterium]